MIDEQNVLSGFAAGLQKQMMDAAEPVIQEALREIERKVRGRVAAAVLTTIEHSYSATRMHNVLEIRVDLGKLQG